MTVSVVLILLVFIVIGLSVVIVSKPVAIVHIGPHKTGSTYIQTSLVLYKTILEQHNYYTFLHPNALKNHAALAYALLQIIGYQRTEEDLHAYEELFTKTAEKNKNILISSEFLSIVSTERLIILYDMLKDFDVHIVFMHRNWLQHEISSYHQIHKLFPFGATYFDLLDLWLKLFRLESIRNVRELGAITAFMYDSFVNKNDDLNGSFTSMTFNNYIDAYHRYLDSNPLSDMKVSVKIIDFEGLVGATVMVNSTDTIVAGICNCEDGADSSCDKCTLVHDLAVSFSLSIIPGMDCQFKKDLLEAYNNM